MGDKKGKKNAYVRSSLIKSVKETIFNPLKLISLIKTFKPLKSKSSSKYRI